MSKHEQIAIKIETSDGRIFEVPMRNWRKGYCAEDIAQMIAVAKNNPNKFVHGGKCNVNLSDD